MTEDVILEVGIDGSGRLFVRPARTRFDYVYRAGMEVGWDKENRYLFSPKPREWSYRRWFDQILAAAGDEYGVRLKPTRETIWSNIPTDLEAEIIAAYK